MSIWITPSELAALPTSGTAWGAAKSAADRAMAIGSLSAFNTNIDSRQEEEFLALCLVAARTKTATYVAKANALADSLPQSVDTGWAATRNGFALVAGLDILGLASDAQARGFAQAVLSGGGGQVVQYSKTRPNNFFGMAMSTRLACHLLLGQQDQVAACAKIVEGWLGNRAAYAGFSYGDLSWQAHSAAPVGINPKDSIKQGVNIDGIIADDLRRGGGFTTGAPGYTGYLWEGLTAVLPTIEMMRRNGYPTVIDWSNRAILRAAQAIARLRTQYQWPWAGEGADKEQAPGGYLLRYFYPNGQFPNVPSGNEGVMFRSYAWTAWTHAGAAVAPPVEPPVEPPPVEPPVEPPPTTDPCAPVKAELAATKTKLATAEQKLGTIHQLSG